MANLHSMPRVRLATATCLAPLLVAGCYTYASIDPAAVRPGTGVRVRVSSAAAERLAPLLGTGDARVLSGQLVDVRTDTMIVQVPTVVQAAVGSSLETLHQRLSIPRSELLELETRRLDRVRTGLVAGSTALLVGGVIVAATKGDRGSDRGPGDGGGPEARLPLIGFRF
jgi:hypothetical protein